MACGAVLAARDVNELHFCELVGFAPPRFGQVMQQHGLIGARKLIQKRAFVTLGFSSVAVLPALVWRSLSPSSGSLLMTCE